jgi:DNA-binding IclR family transcriptional regulator
MTAEVAGRLGHPVQTVLRSLQDMAAHGLVEQW